MSARSDNRIEKRYSICAPIAYTLFSTKHWNYYHSRALNHNQRGLFFKSDIPLTPGTTIYIRIEDSIPESKNIGSWGQFRTATLAQVRWCKQLSAVSGTIYGVGVKYY
jgi:hypothetical protein